MMNSTDETFGVEVFSLVQIGSTILKDESTENNVNYVTNICECRVFLIYGFQTQGNDMTRGGNKHSSGRPLGNAAAGGENQFPNRDCQQGVLLRETVPCDAMTSGFVSDLFTVRPDDKGQTMLVICLQFTL